VICDLADCGQGCQLVYFQIKNPNLGKFWRALDWKMFGMLKYFRAIWNILRPFGIFYDHSSGFGILLQEKSGNPDCGTFEDSFISNF
jgi:hypothetical protein